MKHIFPTLIATVLITGPALAANDGTLGTESSGDFDITYTVTQDANIKITGLANVDLDFSLYDGIPTEETVPLCVYMDEVGSYSVSVKAAPLNDGNADFPYTYTFSDLLQPATQPLQQTISNAEDTMSLSGFTPSRVVDCATGGDSAEFGLVLSQAPAAATAANGATAEIMITVTPD